MNTIANSSNLLDVFYSALSELQNLETAMVRITDAKEQVKENRSAHANNNFFCWFCIVIGLIGCFYGFVTAKAPGGLSLLSLILGVFLIVMGIFLLFRIHTNKKWKKMAKDHENSVLDYEAEYRSLYEKSPNLRMIPADYRSDLALSTMARYIENSRASTWGNCVELYEEQVHRWKVEQNTAEAAAYAKSAAKNARLAAIFAIWSRY